MFWLNPWSARGASHHPAFMGNWPTIIHTFLALSTLWMSSPSRKWRLGVSPWFHLVALVFGVDEEKWGGRGSPRFTNGGEVLRRPSSCRKLLDWVSFRILSNINDGVPLWKYVQYVTVIINIIIIIIVIILYFSLTNLRSIILGTSNLG